MSEAPPAKSPRMEFQRLTMGTHSGAFQADEALGIWMLRQLPKWRGASLTRSRDPKVLEPLDIVIDVGGLYEHAKLRYDHHQRGFFETFDGALGASGGADADRTATGPENATGAFKTKLSASGLVYKHYGRELLVALHPALGDAPAERLEWVLTHFYRNFMEGIDANDNGIEIADSTRYREATTLPHRVHRLNAPWNAPADGPSEDERFERASALCGAEFAEALAHVVDVGRRVRARARAAVGCRGGSSGPISLSLSRARAQVELPARAVVEAALLRRASVHASGEVMALTDGGCPWKTHLCERASARARARARVRASTPRGRSRRGPLVALALALSLSCASRARSRSAGTSSSASTASRRSSSSCCTRTRGACGACRR